MSFKIGDKIVCINKDTQQKYLTIGKVYEVIDTTSRFDAVYIINDNKDVLDYFVYRFRLATLLEKELSK